MVRDVLIHCKVYILFAIKWLLEMAGRLAQIRLNAAIENRKPFCYMPPADKEETCLVCKKKSKSDDMFLELPARKIYC